MDNQIILPGTPEYYAALGEAKAEKPKEETVEQEARKVRLEHYNDMDTTTREYVDALNDELDADALVNGKEQWKILKSGMPAFYKNFRESVIGLPSDSPIWRPLQFELAGVLRDDLDAGHIVRYLQLNPIKRGFFEKLWRFVTRK